MRLARTPGRLRWARVAALLGAGVLMLAGCSGDPQPIADSPAASSGADSGDPSPAPSGSAPSSPGGSGSGATSDSASPSGGPQGVQGGSASDPVTARASTTLLRWHDLGSVSDTVTKTADGNITLDKAARTITAPGQTLEAPDGFSWGEVTVAGGVLLAVAHDKLEEQPARATVLDLDSGDTATLDGDSTVPTIPGGSWALSSDGGRVYYSAYGPGNRYCLAEGTITGTKIAGRIDWCAPARSGYRGVTTTSRGVALTTFDDQQPVSCRTVSTLADRRVTAIDGAAKCEGWDALQTGPDAAIWSVVTNENRIEQGQVLARTAAGYFDLGIGTTGTLTWCGDSAYFVRDAQLDRDKARLLRWAPDGTLSIVFETKGLGNAFLTEPRCSDGYLSISAYAEGGDQQVWAKVP